MLIPIFIKTDGEQRETQRWIETALDCFYISEKIAEDSINQYTSVLKMLNSMIRIATSFCNR